MFIAKLMLGRNLFKTLNKKFYQAGVKMNIDIRKATVSDAKGVSALIVPLTEKYVLPTCETNAHVVLLFPASLIQIHYV